MWAQGGFPITQVRRTVLLAENRDCVFAAASDFLLQWAKNRPTAADFMLKSAHFVFLDKVRRFKPESAFILPPILVAWSANGNGRPGRR